MRNFKVLKNDEVVEVNKKLYEIINKLPAPNSKFNLSADQKYWYKYFGEQLIETKKLTKPDLVHLHRLATAVDYFIQNENQIRTRGYVGGVVQIFKGGASNITGFMTARKSFLSEIDGLSKHFGFSFSDRSKLKENNSAPEQFDMFKQYQEAKHG